MSSLDGRDSSYAKFSLSRFLASTKNSANSISKLKCSNGSAQLISTREINLVSLKAQHDSKKSYAETLQNRLNNKRDSASDETVLAELDRKYRELRRGIRKVLIDSKKFEADEFIRIYTLAYELVLGESKRAYEDIYNFCSVHKKVNCDKALGCKFSKSAALEMSNSNVKSIIENEILRHLKKIGLKLSKNESNDLQNHDALYDEYLTEFDQFNHSSKILEEIFKMNKCTEKLSVKKMCILNWKTQIYDFFCQVCLVDTFTSKIDQLRLVYYVDKKFQPKTVTNYRSVEKFIEHVSVLDSAYDAGQFMGRRVVSQKLQQIFFESSKSFFRAQYEEACKSKIQSFEYIDFILLLKQTEQDLDFFEFESLNYIFNVIDCIFTVSSIPQLKSIVSGYKGMFNANKNVKVYQVISKLQDAQVYEFACCYFSQIEEHLLKKLGEIIENTKNPRNFIICFFEVTYQVCNENRAMISKVFEGSSIYHAAQSEIIGNFLTMESVPSDTLEKIKQKYKFNHANETRLNFMLNEYINYMTNCTAPLPESFNSKSACTIVAEVLKYSKNLTHFKDLYLKNFKRRAVFNEIRDIETEYKLVVICNHTFIEPFQEAISILNELKPKSQSPVDLRAEHLNQNTTPKINMRLFSNHILGVSEAIDVYKDQPEASLVPPEIQKRINDMTAHYKLEPCNKTKIFEPCYSLHTIKVAFEFKPGQKTQIIVSLVQLYVLMTCDLKKATKIQKYKNFFNLSFETLCKHLTPLIKSKILTCSTPNRFLPESELSMNENFEPDQNTKPLNLISTLIEYF